MEATTRTGGGSAPNAGKALPVAGGVVLIAGGVAAALILAAGHSDREATHDGAVAPPVDARPLVDTPPGPRAPPRARPGLRRTDTSAPPAGRLDGATD